MSGIFGTRATLPVDLFLIVLLLCLPAMLQGVVFARRGRIRAHRAVMVTTFFLFVAAILAFEISVRFGEGTPPMPRAPLIIHLSLAVPCLLLWVRQMASGKRAHLEPVAHRARGKMLLLLLCLTVGTGVWLYWRTFVSY